MDASGCGLTGTPRYVTAMGGHSGHFEVTGATAIYAATPTGFRVYVRYANGAPISPAQANQYGWQLNWTALPAAMNRVETKYYHFAGQRIAMKRDGILTYLHSDHLGSAVLETNTSGQIVADQRYYAYGKQRDSGPVGTDHRFTGQKQDGSGLVYMNARYYDPVLGQFISPDTLVPDAGLLMDYNRFMYARGNPLRFNDPSGHFTEDDIPLLCSGCSTWDDVLKFYGNDQEILTFLQHPMITFASIVFGGDKDGPAKRYVLMLTGQGNDQRVDTFYHLSAWDLDNQESVAFTSIFANHKRLTVWSTNTEVHEGGYFYTYWARGFEDEYSARSWAQPELRGFADLQPIPKRGAARYLTFTDWNGSIFLDAVGVIWGGKPTTPAAFGALVIDVANIGTDLYNNVLKDRVYPVIHYDGKIVRPMSLNSLGPPHPR